jgi:iron complex outermembrane receptor protein
MSRLKPSARTILHAGAALAALAAMPAFAQDQTPPAAAEEAAADDPGEITVTARRREESLIDVPI